MTVDTNPPNHPKCVAVVDLMPYDGPLRAAVDQLRMLARERRGRLNLADAETAVLLVAELDQLRRIIRKAQR